MNTKKNNKNRVLSGENMFKNEVIVSEKDKSDMMVYLQRTKDILDKYPYFSCSANTVTIMQRAKCSLLETRKWIGYLYTEKE